MSTPQSIFSVDPLTHDEVLVLYDKIAAGGPRAKRARERLILANTRLVERQAQRISRRRGQSGIDSVDDLFQEGMKGLIRAVDKFDPSMGYAFSTYAMYWIRQSVDRAADGMSSTLSVPTAIVADARQKIASDDVDQMDHKTRSAIEAINIGSMDILLDQPDDSDTEGEALGHIFSSKISSYLTRLPDLQRDIISKRFKFTGSDETRSIMSYAKIAREIGLSPGVVKDLCDEALAELGNMMVSDGLDSW